MHALLAGAGDLTRVPQGSTHWFDAGSRPDFTAIGHTPEGDLRPLLSGYFDTENAGPKKASVSYGAIASAIGCAAPQIVFLSDSAEELDGARAAGWRTVGVRRPGEPNFALGVGDHLAISSFAELSYRAGDLAC